MTLYLILVFLLLSVCGRLSLIKYLRKLQADIAFIENFRYDLIQLNNEYFQSYNAYEKKGNINTSLYNSLMRNSQKAQSMLGYIGQSVYIDRFLGLRHNSYEVLINVIPLFNVHRVSEELLVAADSALLRYLGILQELIEKSQSSLSNPLNWLSEGFKIMARLPLRILNSFGLLSDKGFEKRRDGIFIKLVAFIVAMASLASNLVTIIQGWDDSSTFLENILFRLPF